MTTSEELTKSREQAINLLNTAVVAACFGKWEEVIEKSETVAMLATHCKDLCEREYR
jgi:hypothetical protein